ncbi:hypothetical protein OH76DRAFT_1480341 [Lentinus brumalis]|uniref:ABM domain-containing protein n=1 Tax=Lentinus brumalis TaxID=2498619 RepID=A0A371DJK7_9APHY|nr:hypothetical protein OH76DRAFT_1480341 [Polyporus brumalis]
MGNPTVELAYAAAAGPLLQNPHNKDLFATAASILKEQDGAIKVYHGVQHEDKATAYLVSYEHHEKLINNKETYSKLGGSITSLFDFTKGPPTMVHVKPRNEPYKAFEAPVAEIATFTLHEGKSKLELEGVVDGLAKHLGELVKTNSEEASVFYTSWGPLKEKDNVLVLFIGWTSVEAHWDLVKSDQGSGEFITKIKALADASIVHVPLILD